MSKLMMLVAAKWRDFSEINPHLQNENDPAESSDTPSRSDKPGRGRPPSNKDRETSSKVKILALYLFFLYRI